MNYKNNLKEKNIKYDVLTRMSIRDKIRKIKEEAMRLSESTFLIAYSNDDLTKSIVDSIIEDIEPIGSSYNKRDRILNLFFNSKIIFVPMTSYIQLNNIRRFEFTGALLLGVDKLKPENMQQFIATSSVRLRQRFGDGENVYVPPYFMDILYYDSDKFNLNCEYIDLLEEKNTLQRELQRLKMGQYFQQEVIATFEPFTQEDIEEIKNEILNEGDYYER